MKAHLTSMLSLSLASTLIAACDQGGTSSTGSAAAVPPPSIHPQAAVVPASASAAPAAAAATCNADPSWVLEPSFPPEVPNQEKALCDFQQLAWRDFLALVQPVAGSSTLAFETWMTKEGVFQPERYEPGRKAPFGWGERLPVPRECGAPADKAKGVRLLGLIRPRAGGFAGEIQQAGTNTAPLVDQQGHLVFYEQRFNKTQYDYLTGCGLFAESCFDALGTGSPDDPTPIDFPDQSVEIKTSWRVVSAEEKSRYYTVDAFVEPTSPENPGCSVQTLGLVGFHIVHKTPNHPEWIWETFAHEDNAPSCEAPAVKSPSGADWAFYDPKCDAEKCPPNLFRNPCGKEACQPCNPDGGAPSKECLSSFKCGGDLAGDCQTVGTCAPPDHVPPTEACSASCYDATCREKATPTQACQAYPTGFMGKGRIDPSIKALNDSVHSLPQLPAVWRHYNLIGTEWFGGNDGKLPVKIHHDPSTGKANNPLEGSPKLSNVTMETYNQGLERGCFACHNGMFSKHDAAFPQADFSHLFAGMSIAGGGACKVDPTYKGVCPKVPRKAN